MNSEMRERLEEMREMLEEELGVPLSSLAHGPYRCIICNDTIEVPMEDECFDECINYCTECRALHCGQ